MGQKHREQGYSGDADLGIGITSDDLYKSSNTEYQAELPKWSALGIKPTLPVSKVGVKLGHNFVADNAVMMSEDRLHVRIFYIGYTKRDLFRQATQYLKVQIDETRSHPCVDIIVIDDDDDSTKEWTDFLTKLFKTTGRRVPILYSKSEEKLSSEIEKSLDKQIALGFEHMFSYLDQHFVRKNTPYDLNSIYSIPSRQTIVGVIKDTVNADIDADVEMTGKISNSFKTKVMHIICRKLLCAIVPTLAAKYVIPDIVCHQLLLELNFENDIMQAVGEKTRTTLTGLFTATEKVMERQNITSKSVSFAIYRLRTDLRNSSIFKMVDRNFNKAQRLTTIMKKISFELKDYLRQSSAHSNILDIENPRPIIPVQLRKDILSIKDVYGMGTFYGQLEIHVRPSKDCDTSTKNRIAEQIQKHRFPFSFCIKIVAHELRPFFRQGVKTFSHFPNDRSVWRIGTVGCFVKDQNGKPHILTCAHTVSPGHKDRHTVLLDRNGQEFRFGFSTPAKTICSGTNSSFPLVDIAAVGAVDDPRIAEAIDFNMRDDSRETKHVAFSCDLSNIPDGKVVYKHGGMTSLTYGTKVSHDYTTAGSIETVDTTDEYLMLIEAIAPASGNDGLLQKDDKLEHGRQVTKEPVHTFSQEGDSGAIICYNDFKDNPNGTIIAVAMLNGGHFKAAKQNDEDIDNIKTSSDTREHANMSSREPLDMPTRKPVDMYTDQPLDLSSSARDPLPRENLLLSTYETTDISTRECTSISTCKSLNKSTRECVDMAAVYRCTNSSSCDGTGDYIGKRKVQITTHEQAEESTEEPCLSACFLLAAGLDSLRKKGYTFVM